MVLRGTRRFSVVEYYSRGKEVGFTMAEAKLILETSKQSGNKDPTSVLWTIRDLDHCIRSFTKRYKAEGKLKDRSTIAFMEKLYTFRNKLEFEQPKYKAGITNSRFINKDQRIKVLIDGIGVFSAVVLESNERHLVISYPVGSRVPIGFQWKGSKVSIYFWRNEDAGYVFDTYVLEDLRIRDIPVLQIGHSNSLFRTQKRKSLRMRARIPAYLYLLTRIEGAFEKPERVPGLKCILQDFSEDGASILIGGKTKPNILIKIQFQIGEDLIVMSGTVCGTEYDAKKNQSLLHLEATHPSSRMLNTIRAHIYNVSDQADQQGTMKMEEKNFVG
jgi:hypothetical protein